MSLKVFAQEILIAEGKYSGMVGTSIPLKALAIMKDYITNKVFSPDVLQSEARIYVAYIQVIATEKGLNSGKIDGYIGPITQAAIDDLVDFYDKKDNAFIRPEELPKVRFPKQYSQEFYDYYGDVNKPISLASVNSPYPLKIAWATDQRINSFKAHSKLVDGIEAILKEVLVEYGYDKIQEFGLDLWGGCYNKRAIRGGKAWSIHSWGAAIDWHPSKNQLKWGRDKAVFAKPEYKKWWEIWESHGWLSLGRKHNFDWMHVQAADTK